MKRSRELSINIWLLMRVLKIMIYALSLFYLLCRMGAANTGVDFYCSHALTQNKGGTQ